MSSLFARLEHTRVTGRRPSTALAAHESLVRRLRLDTILHGHTGCVNTVRYNASGSTLVSGSDDCFLRLWEPQRRRGEELVTSVFSHHGGNIFDACFVPQSGDNVIVSAAADGQVRVNAVEPNTTQGFECHLGMTHCVCMAQEEPHVILSCADDGTVRQFDLREPHQCQGRACANVVATALEGDSLVGFRSMVLNPVDAMEMALACEDDYVRLYDRRVLSQSEGRSNTPVVAKLIPEERHSAGRSPSLLMSGTSGIAYSYDGRELVATYSGGTAYLFDVATSSLTSVLDASVDMPAPDASPSSSAPEEPPRATRRPSAFGRFVEAVRERVRRRRDGDEEEEAEEEQDDDEESLPDEDDEGAEPPRRGREMSEFLRMMLSGVPEPEDDSDEEIDRTERRSLSNWKMTWRRKRHEFLEQHRADVQAELAQRLEERGPRYVHEKSTFTGHRNIRTVKEINFFGPRSEYVVSGSDCGHVFLWRKRDSKLVNVQLADSHVANVVQGHPVNCELVVSGIDNEIKVFRPDMSPEEEEDEEYWEDVVEQNRERVQTAPRSVVLAQLFRLLAAQS